ncbi:MAG: hypothetical protein CL916_08345 [Deltaproteobacteria bacterium]|nr:hypothetical protein [Deltaproteobacteria bacterium]
MRGHIFNFQDYILDVNCMLKVFKNALKLNKRISLVYFNDALITTHTIKRLTECKTWDAVVFSSPFFALQIRVPWWKHAGNML